MADRGGVVDRLQSAERHDPPFAVDLTPVAGGLPALVGCGGKAVHQPQRGRAVAAVLHEGQPFGIGDEVAGKPDRADQGAVRGLFIVEMEAVVSVSAVWMPSLRVTHSSAERCDAGKRHDGSYAGGIGFWAKACRMSVSINS